MSKTLPDDVVKLVMPAIHERINQLLEEAFKLAAFVDSTDVLERSIDSLTARYFQQEAGSISLSDDSDTLAKSLLEIDGAIPPVPFTRPVITKRRHTGKAHFGEENEDNEERPLYELVKAHKYSPTGRPISQYRGVSFSGNVSKPWLARFQESRLGLYKTEEEAAEVYEATRRKYKNEGG